MPEIDTAELCAYTLHDDGVHELRLLAAEPEAWDAFLCELIHLTGEQDGLLRVIIDTTVGSVPVEYANRSCDEWLDDYPSRAEIRAVCLYDGDFTHMLVDNIAQALRARNTTLRFFRGNRRNEALLWLLAD